MNNAARSPGYLHVVAIGFRVLAVAQLRQQFLRTLATVVAVALGVALGAAVYLINSAALSEFDRATRRVDGDADYVIRAAGSGFAESLFVTLARDPAVQIASPMLDLQMALPAATAAAADSGRRFGPLRFPLQVLGVDVFRAAELQPALMGALGSDITALLAPDAIVLSRAAAQQLHLRRGDRLAVIVGSATKSLRIIDVMPGEAYPEPLGIMDIASAQWTLERLGRLNRIELRLRDSADAAAFQHRLMSQLPPGAIAQTPQVDSARAASATRAYRVNLNMLALVALLTGAFLVFATQSLAVLRRRVALGLLRALGMTRAELQGALLAEGVAIGAAGALLGVLLGVLVATAMVGAFGANLGNRQLAGWGSAFGLHPLALAAFALIGTAAATLGAWIPAREAARRAPAAALRAGDVEPVLQRLPTTLPGLAMLLTGAVVAGLPPVSGLPLPGYLAVGYLLIGAVLCVPELMRRLLQSVPATGRVVVDTALAQLRGSAGSSTISLAAVIVSFSLMVAMAIMVHSFRDSFDLWLIKLLPADLQLRASPGNDSAVLSAAEQQRIAGLAGVARVEFQREQSVYLQAARAPVTLIARTLSPADAASALPLVSTAAAIPAGLPPAWISEALQDQNNLQMGSVVTVPIAGQERRFFVAGVWRDYLRSAGSIVISRAVYIAASGDDTATTAAIWQRPGMDPTVTAAAIRTLLRSPAAFEVLSSSAIRERSLRGFDQAFLITYALEAAAVAIGLIGISVAASAMALARRGQFGMLRHVGMLRRQVLGMLACEGLTQSAVAVLCGLALGGVLSVILVYVVNRQSFHWSIDLSIPWGELVALSAALIGAAALTAVWSGRAALGEDVIRAVREDW